MLIQFIRYIHGYLRIIVTGYSPERFLNLCKNKNIDIWGLQPQKDTYKMYIKVKDFKKIKPMAKKTASKVKIEKKMGLPFFFFKFRKRQLFWVGILLSIILIHVMSMRLWSIQISGNQMITKDIMVDYLKEQDISIGTKCKNISSDQLSKNLRADFQEIKWVSVFIDGTVLNVVINENHDKIENQESDVEPCDIVANKSGTITKIITRSGVPLCKNDMSIKAGDILISGKIEVLNDAKEVIENKYVASDGDIWIQSYYAYQDIASKTYLKKQYQKGTQYQLGCKIGDFVFKLNLQKNDEYLKEQTSVFQSYDDFFSIQLTQIKTYEFVNAEYTEMDRADILTERFMRYCKELEEQGIVILDNKLNLFHTDAKSSASSMIRVEEKIGEKRKTFDLSSENMVQ